MCAGQQLFEFVACDGLARLLAGDERLRAAQQRVTGQSDEKGKYGPGCSITCPKPAEGPKDGERGVQAVQDPQMAER